MTQCPTCLSSLFKRINLHECGFCVGAAVRKSGSGFTTTVNVVHPEPVEKQMAAAEAKGFRVQRGSHATRAME